jgi:C-terminal processing protease CtpA/Prc
VYAGGPAESAGIHQDDVIISINGKTSATLDSAALHDILIGPAGSTLHLTVRSGTGTTTTRDVPIVLRDVL